MGWILFDICLLILVSAGWVFVVFLLGYPLKRLFKLPKTLTTDTIILALVYLSNPLGFFDTSFDGFYDITILWPSAVHLPFAFMILYWVHQGEE